MRRESRFSDKVRPMNLSSTQLYFRLLKYVKPYWRTFAISLLGMIVVAATEPLVPALMKPMLDGTFVHKDQEMMRIVPLVIILIFLVRGIATFVGTLAISWVGNKLVMDLREEMFRNVVFATAYYDEHATGSLLQADLRCDSGHQCRDGGGDDFGARLHRDDRLAGLAVLPELEADAVDFTDGTGHRADHQHDQQAYAPLQSRFPAGDGGYDASDRRERLCTQGGQAVWRPAIRNRPF
jgi:hypothetical protein